MRGLGTTLATLLHDKKKIAEALKAALLKAPSGGDAHHLASATPLERVTAFGSNPGALEMHVYAPAALAPSPALVVVLHGCGQHAAGYNDGAGWSALAERHGFVLLFPQQTRANNQQGCFNWFQPADTTRDQGEALSIRQMIDRVVADHGIDRSRVFVTGLSAGGAMAAAMLAAYPELFAAGAIIAGLPYRTASNVQGALESMFQTRSLPAEQWGDRVRAASAHSGPWPRVSIWHGDADTVVKSANAAELVKQWTNVHGLAETPTSRDMLDGQARETWRNAAGEAVVETITVGGMGHGTPLAVGTGEMEGGLAGAFMLDVGISSSHHIAEFFGLTSARPARRKARSSLVRAEASPKVVDADVEWRRPEVSRPAQVDMPDWANPEAVRANVLATITQALRSAGLAK